jgi:hypothetical protein
VRPVRLDPAGISGPTRGQSHGRRWRRTSYGFYVPASVTDDLPEQRVMEQSVRLPAGGAVTGWAACRMHRAAFFDGVRPDGYTRIPVPLALGTRAVIRVDGSVTVSRDRLEPTEVEVLRGVPCTVPDRALFDEMCHARDVREAVVAMDMMAAAELTSIARMSDYVATRAGWNGVPQVRAALTLADEDSRSPNETRMRLVWQLDAGLPRPLVNRAVFDLRGRLLGYADLLDVEAGVVGEYDGADHRTASQHSADVDREARLRAVGLEVFRVTGPDLRDPAKVVRRMRSARSRAAWLPARRRRWTLEPPRGWLGGTTLRDRTDHRDWLRELDRAWVAPDIAEIIGL